MSYMYLSLFLSVTSFNNCVSVVILVGGDDGGWKMSVNSYNHVTLGLIKERMQSKDSSSDRLCY